MDKDWTPSDFATVLNVQARIVEFENDVYLITGSNGKDCILTHFKKELEGGGE